MQTDWQARFPLSAIIITLYLSIAVSHKMTKIFAGSFKLFFAEECTAD